MTQCTGIHWKFGSEYNGCNMLETIYATYATCTIKAWYIYMLKVGEVSDAVWWSIIQTIIIININKDEFFLLQNESLGHHLHNKIT